jgi:hypothetical protein
VNKVFVGTETRDLYGLARTEDAAAWNVSTYVDERELVTQLSEATQHSLSKTKKFPLKANYSSPLELYQKRAEELEAQKEEAKKMLPELKRR